MRVLVVDAYNVDDPAVDVVSATIDTLASNGHVIDHVSVDPAQFGGFMTTEERRAYETDEPLRSKATRDHAARIKACDAIVFCYPTTLYGVPPRLKSWLERVMVTGVAFTLEDDRIRGDLGNVLRLGVVTTSPHGRLTTLRHRDLGYRTIMRSLRLSCNPLCRGTYLRLMIRPTIRPTTRSTRSPAPFEQIRKRFGRW